MVKRDKPLIWLQSEVKTPPFSIESRIEAGYLLRRLQQGELLPMPWSKPMPSIGPRCHELRIKADTMNWRIVYRIDPDVIIILEVFPKKTRETPQTVKDTCKRRLRLYDQTLED